MVKNATARLFITLFTFATTVATTPFMQTKLPQLEPIKSITFKGTSHINSLKNISGCVITNDECKIYAKPLNYPVRLGIIIGLILLLLIATLLLRHYNYWVHFTIVPAIVACFYLIEFMYSTAACYVIERKLQDLPMIEITADYIEVRDHTRNLITAQRFNWSDIATFKHCWLTGMVSGDARHEIILIGHDKRTITVIEDSVAYPLKMKDIVQLLVFYREKADAQREARLDKIYVEEFAAVDQLLTAKKIPLKPGSINLTITFRRTPTSVITELHDDDAGGTIVYSQARAIC